MNKRFHLTLIILLSLAPISVLPSVPGVTLAFFLLFAGLDYLVAAGYNPYAMVEALQMLLNTSRARPPEFLSTHPSPENRIAYLQRRIRAKNYNLTGAAIIGRDRYYSAVLARLSNRG